MKHLGFLLHFYQPPWQKQEVLAKVAEECYFPLLQMIIRHPYARFTVNINYSLIELLQQHGQTQLLSLFQQTCAEEKIELTGSGAYHPIIPLLDDTETRRQIELNEKGLLSTFARKIGPGFFPPEMAFSPALTATLKSYNYEWTITDDPPFQAVSGHTPPFDFIPQSNGLPVFLRSNRWSGFISERKLGEKIFQHIDCGMKSWFGKADGYIIIGMDAETFGHHHHGYIEELRQFLDDLADSSGHEHGWRFSNITEICRRFPTRPMDIPSGSWSTNSDNVRQGVPFPLWDDPHNQVHHLLWSLANLTLKYRRGLSPRSRTLLDKALNSCQYWWAADFRRDYECAFKTVPLYQAIAPEFDALGFQEFNTILNQLSPFGFQQHR